MSLLSDAMEACVMMDRRTLPDYDGYKEQYVPGAGFQAAFVKDTSTQAKTAEVLGVTALYTITTRRNINLQYHDVVMRISDGQIFRVTSKGDDKATPKSASLDMRQVSAEEWRLPNG